MDNQNDSSIALLNETFGFSMESSVSGHTVAGVKKTDSVRTVALDLVSPDGKIKQRVLAGQKPLSEGLIVKSPKNDGTLIIADGFSTWVNPQGQTMISNNATRNRKINVVD